MMKIRHKVQIVPTAEQKQLLNQTFGCCRYVYNKLLDISIKEYQEYLGNKQLPKPNVSGYSLANKLPAIKNHPDTPWLKDVSAVALQQTALNLGSAFSNFFKRGNKGYPKFKSRYSRQSFNLVGNKFDIRDNGLWINKSKSPIKVFWDKRGIPLNPSSVTISRSPTGKYYASFVTEVNERSTTGSGTIGIDLGLTHFATLSNGTKIDNPKHYKRLQSLLRRRQKALSRSQKNSKNREKCRLAVAKVHERIRNAREDFLHKLSTQLVADFKMIAVEDLKVANMVKNHNLAKSIQDASWGRFKQLLIDKTLRSTENRLFVISTWFPSSNICHVTGKKLETKLKQHQRSFVCPHCGQIHDRDLNAAINIKNAAEYENYYQKNVPGKVLLAENPLA